MKTIPISHVKDFAEAHGLREVILIARSAVGELAYVVTWGKTIEDCRLAAESGNNLKRHMGWPEKLCHSTPYRLLKKGIQL